MESIQSFDVKDKIYGFATEVFDTMLSMELEFQEKVAQQYMDGARVLGSINLVGKVMGIITIQVSEEFSCIISGEMLGIGADEIQSMDEIKDVIGEGLNMVAGGLKSSLCDAGMPCQLSPPSFKSGKDFEMDLMQLQRIERF